MGPQSGNPYQNGQLIGNPQPGNPYQPGQPMGGPQPGNPYRNDRPMGELQPGNPYQNGQPMKESQPENPYQNGHPMGEPQPENSSPHDQPESGIRGNFSGVLKEVVEKPAEDEFVPYEDLSESVTDDSEKKSETEAPEENIALEEQEKEE